MVLGFWSRDGRDVSPRMRRFLVVLCVALLLGVAGFAMWRVVPGSESFYTDADTIKRPIAVAQVRDILWQPPVPLSELINTTADDYEPRLSADGLTLFFVRGKAGGDAEIYTSRKTYAGWSTPEPVVTINSTSDDLGPEPSADGKALYFYSNREGTFGGYDLWVARVDGDAWTTPVNLGPRVNSPFNDYGPALTADGETLYFSSNRPQPTDEQGPAPDAWSATLREDLFYRTYDLYSATINDRGIGDATSMAALNTPYNEGAPAVTPFGDFLYFSSDRPGGEGAFDLYRSRQLRGAFQAVTNLGSSINTNANELDPALAMGGYALYFSSDRRGDVPADADEDVTQTRDGKVAAKPEYNLFYSASREVFADTERSDRDPINWAALWGAVGPNLLWALLALLLLLAMLSLFRAMQNRKMSLLAKCLLASLAAHLLLLMLMNAWKVAAGIAGEFNRRGKIQIAIASPLSGDAIAMQIRGDLTQIELPDVASAMPLQRVETSTRATIEIDSATLTVDRLYLAESVSPRESTAVSDAASEPKLAPVIPEHSVELGQAPMMLAATIPNDSSRMDAVETPLARDVAAEHSSSVARANVEASTQQDSARIDIRPAVSAIDLSQQNEVNTVSLVRDQRESKPMEFAFVDSRLPVEASDLVDTALVRPVTPRESTRMNKATETQVETPASESAPAFGRVEVSQDALARIEATGSTIHLATQRDSQLLEGLTALKSRVVEEMSDATVSEKAFVSKALTVLVSAPSMTLTDDLATPQVGRVDNRLVEASAVEVQPLPHESSRSLRTTDFARIVEDAQVVEEMTVALGEIPSEYILEAVTVVDAEAVDQLVADAMDVTPRDNMIPPPLLVAAAMALPAVDRREHEAVEAAVRTVDSSEALPERLHSDTSALLKLLTPIPDTTSAADVLFEETVTPTLAWEDTPTRFWEKVRPKELLNLPTQPVLIESLRLPTAMVATPELNIETLVEEIEPQLQSDDPWQDEIIGMLRGQVSDANTGKPLSGAKVRLTLPFVGAIVVVADGRGRYSMNVPDVPEFFAVSATLDGYVPETKSVSRDRVEGRKLRVNFELSPQNRSTLVMEAIPDVHHLGDNRFEGRINSQFQKESEGDRYLATFTLDSGQLSSDLSEGEVVLLAKGVQRSHRIVINGETLDDRLDDAPSDGSFGEFVAWFDVSILREGENTLEIIAKPSRSDIDDFEFVNVRVRLIR